MSESVGSTSSPVKKDENPSPISCLPNVSSQSVPPFKPNSWWPYKQIIREMAAEFLGTLILVLFGTGALAQYVLSSSTNVSASPKGDWLSVAFGWGVGISLGAWASGGISGGHINPAVTLSLAVWRGFPWRKVPGFIISQLLGGIVAAGCVYANYFHAIDAFEGKGVRTLSTAGIFATYSADYTTNISSFFSEFLATAILMIVVLAATDRNNLAPGDGLLPLALFILFLGLGTSLGMNTGFAVNPARDLGPRILTSMVGYGKAVYTFRNQYWIWCGVLGPIAGANFGALIYDGFLYNGLDSLANQPTAPRNQSQRAGSDMV